MNHSAALIVVSGIQLVLALTFLIAAFGAKNFGYKAQKAAEDNVAKQGFDPSILLQKGFKISESSIEMIPPLAIGAVFGCLGILNLLDIPLGRTLSLILHPIFFLIGGVTTAGQVFTEWFTERAFKKSGDEQLQAINVKELIRAAESQFPNWLRPVIITRFILVTLGSITVVILLTFGV